MHLHYLHHGREPGKIYQHPGVAENDPSTKWAIHPREIRSLWQRLLQNLLGVDVDCATATRIEQVKLDASHYLSKYMSKGGKVVQKIKDSGQSHFLPSAWYGVSSALRREIKNAIANLTVQQAEWFLENLDYLRELGVIDWLYPIYQEMWLPGELAPYDHLVGAVGSLSGEHALRYLKGELDEYGYRNWYLSDEFWATA